MGIYRPLKIAIIYDWIDKWGGVERVLLTLAEIFPRAHFYTSYFNPETAPWAKKLEIRPTFIQSLPGFVKKSRVLSFPLYPYAFESLNFSDYDIVISITSSFAKGIITKPETMHICYLLTPPRYLWTHKKEYLGTGFPKKIITKYQKWDYVAAQRPDKIISISKAVQERVKKYYDRYSDILYPPFDLVYWRSLDIKNSMRVKIPTSDFYLVVSRLEPYKRVDLAINAFKGKEETLIIVGRGTQQTALRRTADKNILFLQHVTDEELAYLYSHAQALIMPQEEDFGYVALEAQFFGCPVIAYKKGGAVETVVSGKTGMFFEEQTAKSLTSTLERFGNIAYNLRETTVNYGRKVVEKFDKKNFESKFIELINQSTREI